ncbi:ABC transporter substrate-binding protein [Marinobacter bryozoorum]|uniref:ABC transporter substrate-binding protein n=1 Tax=Marinobacter bryozoorum TaxID=256324 RepID=UPI0020066756|nr:ABC transporter substrate-binding protein [Marinobacter bryozoorum]MCK7543257.1 ABC transporter substrate-binding protein [Marinobacter bryozoorum]
MRIRKLLIAISLSLVSLTAIAETLKLGLNYPQSGRYEDQGLQQRLGAFLAVEEVNQQGGILGQEVELVIRNTRSDPERSVRNTADLIDNHDVQMVFGGVSSAVAIAAGKAAKERDRIYFGTLTYSNATTGSAGHTHMFREPYNAWMSAKALGRYLSKEHGDSNYYFVTADYTWGWTVEESLRQFTGTTDTSAHPGVTTPFPTALTSDFQAALNEAAESNADVLALVLFGDDMVRAINIAYSMGLHERMQIVVPNITLGMARQVGPTIMEGVIGAAPWVWNLPVEQGYEQGEAFVKAFSDQYNMRPSSAAASAYSIVHQYKDAVERAGTTRTDAVIRALEGHRYSLLKDEQEWRAFDHQNVQSVHVVKLRPREQVLADEYSADYFEVVHSLPGAEAARTLEEWQQDRRQTGMPLTLQ